MTTHYIHRGLAKKKFKENTIPAFRYSFKKRYGIETDIHATKDHEFICFHDFTLNRIFKTFLCNIELELTNILPPAFGSLPFQFVICPPAFLTKVIIG